MSVLRDVIANFAVVVDDKPLTKMDRSLDNLTRKVKKFAVGTAAAFGAAGYAGYKLVTAASDADEALNVLQATFKNNSDEVLKWSDNVAHAMGRSKYEFQDAAGKFGAFLTPIFKGTNTDIAGMSKQLTELSVDLASFYNTSDSEAVMRLFSGMSGETEAVRRYGIDISDAALDAFNKEQGDDRTMRSLSMKEKSALRFKKILQDTVLAQGDAIKTADSWANQVRRAQSRMKEIAVDMGRALMPVATKLLKIFNKFLDLAEHWREVVQKIVSTFNSILFMAVSYTAYWVIINRQLLHGLALLVKHFWVQQGINKKLKEAVLLGGKLLAIFLAVEDVFAFLGGQGSIIGDIINSLTGGEDALGALERAGESIMVAFKNGYYYIRNAVQLLLQVPSLLGKIARGEKVDFAAISKDTMGRDIRDLGAERDADMKDRAQRFGAGVEFGGQGGLDQAVNARQVGESKRSAALRYIEERKAFIKASLTSDMLGKVTANTKLANGAYVTSEDIAHNIVPKEYVPQGNNGRDALTMQSGNLEIGEVKVYVNGNLPDAKDIGKEFVKGVEEARNTRKK